MVKCQPGTVTGGGAPMRFAVVDSSDADICGSLAPKTTSLRTGSARNAVNWAAVRLGIPYLSVYVTADANPGC